MLTEHSLVCEVLHDKPHARREDTDEDMQVKEEGCPCGGLMLRHTGYDGDVDLGIPGGEGGKEMRQLKNTYKECF